MKPENILLKSQDKSGLKIIDFGSSCFSNQRIYTYIQSRFYRAPEIILGIPYTTAIDMWSMGCILVELYTGIPIFPGESEHEQLSLIMQVIGTPTKTLLEDSSRKANFFEPDSNQLAYDVEDSTGSLRIPGTKPLLEIVGDESQSFLSFLQAILVWDPVKRMSPIDALQHAWITEGLPPQVLVHHRRMLGLEVTGSSESSLVPDVNRQHTLIGESIERPTHQLDLLDEPEDYCDQEPKMSQTQPLSKQLQAAKQAQNYGNNKIPVKPSAYSKTTNLKTILSQIN